MIVIIAALKAEIVPLINILGINDKISLDRGTLYPGEEVSLIRTGVGEKKSIEVLREYINNYSCDFLLNIGFAGTLDVAQKSGDCFFITEMVSVDLNKAPIPVNRKYSDSFKKGRLLTVKEAVLTSKTRDELKNQFGALLVDMEGYGLADYCRKKNLPLASIKIISDQADERAKTQIMQSYKALAKDLAQAALTYLKSFSILLVPL